MAVSSGPGVASSGLVFAYDMANREKSFLGAPATNTCSFGSYNYVWGNGVVTRNTTAPVPPPITGYEIAKLQSTDGVDTQTILYTAGVDQVNGGVYTHSAWIYLESGNWASVGQHWNPWDYGTWQYITPGRWTRISYTLTNSPNNYGAVALSYNTNGTIYITASQYEKAPFMGKFIGGAGATRTNTQSLLDLTGQNTLTANSLTYNTDGTFTFATGVNYCTVSSLDSLVGDVTLEALVNLDTANGPHQTAICTDLGYRYGIKLLASYHGNMAAWAGFGTTDYLISGPNIQNTGNNYICLTRSSSTGLISIYRNGLLVGTGTGNTGNMSSAGSAQGRLGLEYHSTGYGFNGKINFARAYNRVLTADEVAQNFAATRSRYGI